MTTGPNSAMTGTQDFDQNSLLRQGSTSSRLKASGKISPEVAMEGVVIDDLFERWAWLYTLCREHVFADHTELVASVMNERFHAVRRPLFLEVGCGPGFYAISMARRFPRWRIVGMDKSLKLLERAESKVLAASIANCSFCRGDVTCSADFPEKVDLLLASRLLLILPDRLSALRAMYSALRPGGNLLIAEPLPGWRPRLALTSMKLLRSMDLRGCCPTANLVAPQALTARELSYLISSLPWAHTRLWSDHRYQYVLSEKPMDADRKDLDQVEQHLPEHLQSSCSFTERYLHDN